MSPCVRSLPATTLCFKNIQKFHKRTSTLLVPGKFPPSPLLKYMVKFFHPPMIIYIYPHVAWERQGTQHLVYVMDSASSLLLYVDENCSYLGLWVGFHTS